MARKDFRVLIAGAGVAGLTLANILEQLGIDFLVLESYKEVSPQVGASIGLFPNGMRVLDQIGVLAEFAADLEPGSFDMSELRIRNKLLMKNDGMASLLEAKHGYRIMFNDRQRLLMRLYEKLAQKDKVLTNKKVVRVEPIKGGVKVEAKDGTSYTGHMLVGADGIHSSIRSEMWRIAEKLSPGYFPADGMKDVPIRYRCIFGISRPTSSYPPALTTTGWFKGHSQLIIGGPGGRVYYFFFEALPEPTTGANCPRYTKQDELELVERHRDVVICEGTTLGQLYDHSITSGLTPLHEHVFPKWHYGRIITLGDSAHKPNPISGQGGNGAVESVAELANQLTAMLDSPSWSSSGVLPSDAAVEAALRATWKQRQERANLAIATATKSQGLAAMESPVIELLAPLLTKMGGEDVAMEPQSLLVVNAHVVKGLPLPQRPHYIPYTSELPATPLKGFVASVLPRLLVAMGLVGMFVFANKALRTDIFPPVDPTVIKSAYTGIAPVDHILTLLVGAFWSAIAEGGRGTAIQTAYLLATIAAPILIWKVEGYRRGLSAGASFGKYIIGLPDIFLIAMQILGIARVAPVYFLASLYFLRDPILHRTSGRPVDPFVARALLPALTLGFAIPTVRMFMRLDDNPSAWQDNIANWQIAPVNVAPLVALGAAFFSGKLTAFAKQTLGLDSEKKTEKKEEKKDFNLGFLQNKDAPHLLGAYAAVGCVLAAVHVCAGMLIAKSPSLSFGDVFWAPLSPTAGWEASGPLSAADANSLFLRYDLIGLSGTLLLWCVYTVFEMRRLGYVSTKHALAAAVAVPLATVVLGPGAMYAGVWYWRESVVVGLSELGMKGKSASEEAIEVREARRARGEKDEVEFTDVKTKDITHMVMT